MEKTIVNESEVDNLNNAVSKSNDLSETDEHTANFDKTLPTGVWYGCATKSKKVLDK